MEDEQICRLCLQMVPDGNAEVIEEKKKGILEVLLINVDWDISDTAVACNRCVRELKDCFDFKSTCFQVDNCIASSADADIRVDMRTVFQKMRSKINLKINVKMEDLQICRLCASLIDDKALYCNTNLKDLITHCLPQVDLNAVQEPVLCERCLSHATRLNKLMQTCQEVERRIKDYYQVAIDQGHLGKVFLYDLLKFESFNKPIKEESPFFDVTYPDNVDTSSSIKVNEFFNTPIKEECSSFDVTYPDNVDTSSSIKVNPFFDTPIKEECSSFDVSLMPHPKNEDNVSIKCEEINIKDEADNGPVCQGSSNNEKIFSCHYCEYTSKLKSNLNRHISVIHERDNATVYPCQQCPYKTIYQQYFQIHLSRHEQMVQYKCPDCEKEFNGKKSLDNHLLKRHEDSKYLITSTIFYCKLCTYKTTLTTSLTQHITNNHDRTDKNKFWCHNCDYFAFQKSVLKRHLLVHANSKPFLCDSCKKGFNQKNLLHCHILSSHKDNAELQKTVTSKLYLCTMCNFVTITKNNLSRHITGKHKK